jgi:hypothetical protein
MIWMNCILVITNIVLVVALWSAWNREDDCDLIVYSKEVKQ